MNPVFTLNYPEFLLAQELQSRFAKKNAFSVLIPLSAQQKGYDVALMRHCKGYSIVATFQMKSSKTYGGTPGIAANGLRTFTHYMWLRRFAVPQEADFFVLLGLYATKPASTKNTSGIWKHQMLLFTQAEMVSFMASIRQRRINRPDSHFGFGFDRPNAVFQTRGHAQPQHPDYTRFLLTNRLGMIQTSLSCQRAP